MFIRADISSLYTAPLRNSDCYFFQCLKLVFGTVSGHFKSKCYIRSAHNYGFSFTAIIIKCYEWTCKPNMYALRTLFFFFESQQTHLSYWMKTLETINN